jgi:uncharacterized membrane protein
MYQLSVLLHLLGAVIWIGGMLSLALVVVPVAREYPPPERAALLDAIGRRFRRVGWLAVLLLVLTGPFAAAYHGLTWESLRDGTIFANRFGQLLGLKVVAVAAMVGVTALHDFVAGPASARALGRDGAAPAPARARTAWLARLGMLLALVVLALGVLVARGLPA